MTTTTVTDLAATIAAAAAGGVRAGKFAQVRFDDREYRSSHGAAPRGRGSWAFVFRHGLAARCDDYTTDEIWFAPGSNTLGEAKKLATAEARVRFPTAKYVTVAVCS